MCRPYDKLIPANRSYLRSPLLFCTASPQHTQAFVLFLPDIHIYPNLSPQNDCYEEFVKVAPKDPNQHILKYKILKAQRSPVAEQIAALEDFKKAEYVEKWAVKAPLSASCGLSFGEVSHPAFSAPSALPEHPACCIRSIGEE